MKLRWLVPALALLAAGCIKEKTLLVVNPDGSGSIVLDTSISAEAAAMMNNAAASFGAAFGETNGAAAVKEELIKEEDLRERASDFGEGVEFVRLKRTKADGQEGAIALFSFKDITKLRIPLQQNKGMGGGEEEDADSKDKKEEKAVTFAFTDGPTKKLVVNVPQEEKKAEAKPAAEGAKELGGLEDLGAAMMGPMMQMFKGLEMSMAIQVKGDVVNSTATHPQGAQKERAVLMSLNFDEMMKSPKFAEIFKKSQGGEMPTGALVGLPGFTFETKPQVVIEFK